MRMRKQCNKVTLSSLQKSQVLIERESDTVVSHMIILGHTIIRLSGVCDIRVENRPKIKHTIFITKV